MICDDQSFFATANNMALKMALKRVPLSLWLCTDLIYLNIWRNSTRCTLHGLLTYASLDVNSDVDLSGYLLVTILACRCFYCGIIRVLSRINCDFEALLIHFQWPCYNVVCNCQIRYFPLCVASDYCGFKTTKLVCLWKIVKFCSGTDFFVLVKSVI